MKWGKYSKIQETAVFEMFDKSFCSKHKTVLPYPLNLLEDECLFFHRCVTEPSISVNGLTPSLLDIKNDPELHASDIKQTFKGMWK